MGTVLYGSQVLRRSGASGRLGRAENGLGAEREKRGALARSLGMSPWLVSGWLALEGGHGWELREAFHRKFDSGSSGESLLHCSHGRS